jgi:hypothetical protein
MHGMVAFVIWVDRGIVVQSRNGICDRIVDPFYIEDLR